MRIIAGKWRGRKIKPPESNNTRPTGDRVKESCFSIIGQDVENATVLDLFAGTGNLGLEALSRGANTATFVEKSSKALSVVRSNVDALAATEDCTLIKMDALTFIKKSPVKKTFDLVFLDPPYLKIDISFIFSELANSIHILENALIVLEHPTKQTFEPKTNALVQTDSRRYGDTSLTFYRKEK